VLLARLPGGPAGLSGGKVKKCHLTVTQHLCLWKNNPRGNRNRDRHFSTRIIIVMLSTMENKSFKADENARQPKFTAESQRPSLGRKLDIPIKKKKKSVY
jgi:hypothetical protein